MVQKSVLFLSSYSPVLVLLGLQAFWGSSLILAVILFVAAFVGVLGLVVALGLTRTKPTSTFYVDSRRDAGAESAAFLAGYLLPLLTASIEDDFILVAALLYLAMAWVVTVRSSLIQVNPLLLLIGFRITQVEFSSPDKRPERTIGASRQATTGSGYFLTRDMLRPGDEVTSQKFGGEVFLVRLNPRPGAKG